MAYYVLPLRVMARVSSLLSELRPDGPCGIRAAAHQRTRQGLQAEHPLQVRPDQGKIRSHLIIIEGKYVTPKLRQMLIGTTRKSHATSAFVNSCYPQRVTADPLWRSFQRRGCSV